VVNSDGIKLQEGMVIVGYNY